MTDTMKTRGYAKYEYGSRKDYATTQDYRDAQRKAEETFKKDLEVEFFGERVSDDHGEKISRTKLDKLFSLAWSYGHSAGYEEVYSYYSDLADLVK